MIVTAYSGAQMFPDLSKYEYGCLGEQRQVEGRNPFNLALYTFDMFPRFFFSTFLLFKTTRYFWFFHCPSPEILRLSHGL